MTGLDRLHGIAEDVGRTVWLRELGAALDDIADGIEGGTRDISGYESDVLAWVEENGGLDAVKERTMPEGMSWPFYEDGEPVRLGEHWQQDGYDWSITSIDSIEFAEDGVRLENEYADAFYRYGERVKRPAPPVLAADGEPLEVGQTVWHIADGKEYTVEDLFEDAAMVTPDGITGGRCRAECPEHLTHERPDSFSLIEQDAELCPYDYAMKCGKPDGVSNGKFQRVDLVRRARALAERGE